MSRSRRSGRGFRVSDQYIANNPDADPTATELVINLLVTTTLLQGQLDGLLRKSKLTIGSFNVLQVLDGDPQPCTPSDIAARVVIPFTTATLSGVLDTLERHRYVERRPHPTDRRRLLVHLTPKGRGVLAKVVPSVLQHEREWTAAVDKSTRVRLTDGLAAIQEHLRGPSTS